MKQTLYNVEFYIGIEGVGPFAQILAFTAEQATILAQAERIKKGLDYRVEHVWVKNEGDK